MHRHDDILATGGVHIGGTDFDKQLSLHGGDAAVRLRQPDEERRLHADQPPT
jgi:hypothetical protein